MSLILNVEILGEFKKLTAATQGAETSLQKLNGVAGKISSGMTAAFAAIGIGFSVHAIVNGLEEASKAAIDDRKSQELLALAMRNTAKATDQHVAAAEKAIQKMQFSAGVADDELRPAYQKLFIATKDVEQSNKLLQVALDASAGTGKNLDAVSQAMAKSLAGSDTALVKLIPSLKGAKDPLQTLADTFKGAAENAANLDPYQKMQVLLGDMQEQIGMAVLPVLDKFSKWLSTPEGQEKLQAIVDGIKGVVTELGKWVVWIVDNKELVLTIGGAIGAITIAIEGLKVASAISAGSINASFLKMFGWVGVALAALQVIKDVNAALGASTPQGQAIIGGQGFNLNSTATATPGGSNMTFSKPIAKPIGTKPTTNVTVNVKSTSTAKEIATAVSKASSNTGKSTIATLQKYTNSGGGR